MLADWIAAARPKTLPAAVVPILVGAAESHRMGFFALWPLAVCLVFALLVQIATNLANDYYDHIRGADTAERVGPERLVSSGRIAPPVMLWVSVAVFAVAFFVGLNLVAYRGWELLVVGVVSILFGYGYTGGPFPLAYRGLGDVFVVFFFGLVATMGTVYVMSGELTAVAALQGLVLGLLANNILVVNNYRDVETDCAARKMTLVARWGRGFGRRQYWAQLFVAFGGIVALALVLEKWILLMPLVVLPLALRVALSLSRERGAALNGVLARTAAILLATGLLLALGIYFA